MNRYDKIIELFPNEIGKECPIIMQRGAILKDVISNKFYLQLKFSNSGKKAIQNVYINLKCSNTINVKEHNVKITYLNLNSESGACFGSKILTEMPEIYNNLSFLEIVVEYSDGTKDCCESDNFIKLPEVIYLKKIVPDKMHQYIESESNLKCQPGILQEGIRRCVCGGIACENDCCPNCGRNSKQAMDAAKISNITNGYERWKNSCDKEYKSEYNEKRSYLPIVAAAVLLFGEIIRFISSFGYMDIELEQCIALLLIITLLFGKKNVGLALSLGVRVAYDIFIVAVYLLWYYPRVIQISWDYPMYVIVGVVIDRSIHLMLFIMLLTALRKSSGIIKSIMKKIWFVPGVLQLVSSVLNQIFNNHIILYDILIEVSIIIFVLILAYWLTHEKKESSNKAQ